jgi:hypothetical protein
MGKNAKFLRGITQILQAANDQDYRIAAAILTPRTSMATIGYRYRADADIERGISPDPHARKPAENLAIPSFEKRSTE